MKDVCLFFIILYLSKTFIIRFIKKVIVTAFLSTTSVVFEHMIPAINQ